ncbi:DAW1 [Branchiostoma lanceolatum]|uniref:DAW1 protein n=1 Tax=Branchiostoma lanceolatum TaxID=7740 RepID=A0A8J9YYP8_BRALA|nr:DAW1 [Branchiostoma lanceolatum]
MSGQGIILEYEQGGQTKTKSVDLLDLKPETDVDAVLDEISRKEPLITPSRMDQVRTLVKKLQQKLAATDDHAFYLFKVLRAHILPLTNVAFNKSGSMFITGSYDRTCKVWDTASGEELHTLEGHRNVVYAIAFNNPYGDKIATGSFDKTCKLWSSETGKCYHTFRGHTAEIVCTAFNPQSTIVATGSMDTTAKIWDVQTGQEISTLMGHSAEIISLSFNTKGDQVITGSFDHTVTCWDVRSGSNDGGTTKDVEARIGKAKASFAQLKPIWRARNISVQTKLRILEANVKSVLLYGCETWGLTQLNIKKLQTFINSRLRFILGIWWPKKISNVELLDRTGQEPVEVTIRRRKWMWVGHTLRKPPADITRTALEWNPQGKRKRGRPRLSWRRGVRKDLDSANTSWQEAKKTAGDRKSRIHTLIGHRGEISSAQFNWDCSLIATGSMDNTCKIWDARTGQCIGTLRGHEDEVLDVAFDYTGQLLATASADSKYYIYEG